MASVAETLQRFIPITWRNFSMDVYRLESRSRQEDPEIEDKTRKNLAYWSEQLLNTGDFPRQYVKTEHTGFEVTSPALLICLEGNESRRKIWAMNPDGKIFEYTYLNEKIITNNAREVVGEEYIKAAFFAFAELGKIIPQ